MKQTALSALVLALLLAACNTTPTPNGSGTGGNSTGGTPQGTVVSGNKVLNGPGAGQVVFQMPTGATSTSGTSDVARADVAADGSFTVTLPDEAHIPYLGNAYATAPQQTFPGVQCTQSLSSSNPDARGNSISSGELLQGGVAKGPLSSVSSLTPGSTSATLFGWTYVDRDVTTTGTVDCAGSSSGFNLAVHLDYNAALTRGWNVMKISFAYADTGVQGSVTAEPLHGLNWTFTANQ